MEFDYLALDFETATRSMGSACALGVVGVKDLRVVEERYSLLKPPGLLFEPGNVMVHGITPDMVAHAPTLDEFWGDISWMFSEDCPVCAHNARFDTAVLKASCTVPLPNFPVADTVAMAAPLVPGSRSLDHCAQVLRIDLEHHHNALDDARCCAEIAARAIRADGSADLLDYLSRRGRLHRLRDPWAWEGSYGRRRTFPTAVRPGDIIPKTDLSAMTGHPLYGKSVVFTGELSIDRRTAMQMAADVGAVLKSGVSRSTDYLVAGRQDAAVVGADGISSKERAARTLNAQGKAHIAILDEAAFLRLVEGG